MAADPKSLGKSMLGILYWHSTPVPILTANGLRARAGVTLPQDTLY
jgi:hypothetical protein